MTSAGHLNRMGSVGRDPDEDLALAALYDPDTGRPLGSWVPIVPPGVPVFLALRDDWLLWGGFDPSQPVDPGHLGEVFKPADSEGMLERFSEITTAHGVLAFAKRYGVLGLCKHGLPCSHNPPRALGGPPVSGTWCHPMVSPTFGSGTSCEPVERWLHFARQARAVLVIAGGMSSGAGANRKAWQDVYEDLLLGGAGDRSYAEWLIERMREPKWARFHLTRVVNEWLVNGGVRPAFLWPEQADAPSFALTGGTFGILAVQLMLTVSKPYKLAACSGCDRRYFRKRKPQRGRGNYCPGCQADGTAARIRKRAQRAKSRLT